MTIYMKGVLTAAFLCLPLASRAEVTEVLAGGFSISHTVNTSASVADSWAVMLNHIDEWWNPEHTWSGSAGNLYIEAEVGGCFCERLPQENGAATAGVEHLHIIYLNPNHEIRFDGALGPLQTMAVAGRMVWKIAATEAGTNITFTYRVHGALAGGFDDLAPAVDGVISQQLDRLAQRLETH